VIVKWLRNNTAKTLGVATEGLIAVMSLSVQRLATPNKLNWRKYEFKFT
tara:strand:- start:2274 stop:2420 length:147 start_codon:yes stop_codon:yes gene_type:complete